MIMNRKRGKYVLPLTLSCTILLSWLLVPTQISAEPTVGKFAKVDASTSEGKKLYLTFCYACHGQTGRGEGEASKFLPASMPDFTNEEYMRGKTDHQLYESMIGKEGMFHATKYIPQYKFEISEDQMSDLIAYIRSFHLEPRGNFIEGRKLFLAYCTPCHGRNGTGEGRAAKYLPNKPQDLTNHAHMSTKTDEELYKSVLGERAAHGSEFMPQWGIILKPQQIWDVVAYVRLLHQTQDRQSDSVEGQNIYAGFCIPCHGPQGKGDGPIAKAFHPPPQDLTDKAYMQQRTDLDLYTAILGGGKAVNQSEFMPAWNGVLTDKEVWDLIAYLRVLNQ